MKTRKPKDIQRVLQLKGFELNPDKGHHQYYFLVVGGKKTAIKTYFSHDGKDYDDYLMQQVKKQLKFQETKKAEDFFDCPMSAEQYVEMLKELGHLK